MDKDILIALITVSVPAIITIIGFVITYKATKKNFTEELNNAKKVQNIEKLQDIIYSITDIMNNIDNLNIEHWRKIMSSIISYGSIDSVKIITYFQTTLYEDIKNPLPKQEKMVFMLTTFSLLITQIKYDLTGEILPPLTYLKIKLTDFKTYENQYYIKNNQLVDELNLNPNFKTI